MPRLFIAIALPGSVKAWIQTVQKELKKSGIRASWPGPETLHLTLKFLGDVDPGQVDAIKKTMVKVAESPGSISLYGGSLGVFSSVKRARVLWAGVHGDTERLARLVKQLEGALNQSIDIAKEKKRFSPHLTLARIKQSPPPRKVVALIREFQHERTDSFSVDRIVLFKSELHSSGAVHTPLFSAKLLDRV